MIAVACHDAGGAEIVSSLVQRGALSCRFAVAGPAARIFQRKLGPFSNERPGDILPGAERLICGTSLPATLELEAIALARRHGVRSVAILDHWINYRERFARDQHTVLPDELWVVDETAERLARAAFPETPVTRIENPYRLDFLERLRAYDAHPPDPTAPSLKTALYVTEPTSEHAARMHGDPRYWGYTETEALQWFLSLLPLIDPQVGQVIVRPHPSEQPAKYAAAAAGSRLDVTISNDRDLIEEIHGAALVAGCNSMAMVVGGWAGKRVICCIPPGGRGYVLPGEGVEFAAQNRAWTAARARNPTA